MTHQTAKERLEAVKAGFARLAAEHVSTHPGSCTQLGEQGDPCGSCDHCDATKEFSWVPCEICRSRLGGNREAVVGMGPFRVYSACTDCYWFSGYGRLDDMSMLEIEDEQP